MQSVERSPGASRRFAGTITSWTPHLEALLLVIRGAGGLRGRFGRGAEPHAVSLAALTTI